MNYSVAANSGLVGDPKGNFHDDLTNPNVGQWPKTDNIKKITKIAVYAGTIIDSIRITYQLVAPPTSVTIQHGGPGGAPALSFDIGANEKLIAVYGARLVTGLTFGAHNIVRLSFIVADYSGAVPITHVHSVTGQSLGPSVKFDFTWAVAGATSYTLQPPGEPISYLQALGFSQVLDKV